VEDGSGAQAVEILAGERAGLSIRAGGGTAVNVGPGSLEVFGALQ